MESKLDSDTLYSIITEVAASHPGDLRSLSLSSRLLRELALPVLFSDMRWPHGDKHSEENGLEFFPASLWRHFRTLSLVWPDHWPDSTPPLWGDRYYPGGDYHPRHLDKLVQALPQIEGLFKFHISCPFYPPSSIFTALVKCPSVRSLSISDTPLYSIGIVPLIDSDFHLEHLSIVPVAEALRVGEGPYDSKYQEVAYYVRDYRKKYKNDSLARSAADAFLFKMAKASSLRSVQISGDLCSLDDLAQHEWPNLRTLILTGHAPRQQRSVELVDVIVQMPKLVDLRLLFATVKNDPLFRVLPASFSSALSTSFPSHHSPALTAKGNPANLLSQIRYLALSNACQLSGSIFHYANQLERLVICAISDLPRVPVALSRAEINALLNDLGAPLSHITISSTDAHLSSSSSPGISDLPLSPGSGSLSSFHALQQYPTLKLLRIMIEDKANPDLCHRICRLFPNLESLEVELCGYHDGKSIYAWNEFASAFTPLEQLKRLRLCIQFPEFDEADRVEPWRHARKECAHFFASRLPSLEHVGFEYRKRTGTHRYEDSWLEYEVRRYGDDGYESSRMRRPSVTEREAVVGGGVIASSGYVPYHIQDPRGFDGQYGGRKSPDSAEFSLGNARATRLEELPPSWYRFPEVWTPEYVAA